MWHWMPLTVSTPDSEPRRPFLIMSPSVSTEVGSPMTQKSKRFAACLQGFDDGDGAVGGIAFLVRGEQEGERAGMLRVGGDEGLGRGQHRCQRGFHVGRAAPVEHAVTDFRGEGRRGPQVQRSGRHHVGVAGEDEQRPGACRGAPRDW